MGNAHLICISPLGFAQIPFGPGTAEAAGSGPYIFLDMFTHSWVRRTFREQLLLFKSGKGAATGTRRLQSELRACPPLKLGMRRAGPGRGQGRAVLTYR